MTDLNLLTCKEPKFEIYISRKKKNQYCFNCSDVGCADCCIFGDTVQYNNIIIDDIKYDAHSLNEKTKKIKTDLNNWNIILSKIRSDIKEGIKKQSSLGKFEFKYKVKFNLDHEEIENIFNYIREDYIEDHFYIITNDLAYHPFIIIYLCSCHLLPK